MAGPIEKYTALVIQPEVTLAHTREDIQVNLERVLQLIDFGVGYFWEVPSASPSCPSTSSRA